VRGTSFAGISLNQKSLPLDISMATKFAEKGYRERIAIRLGHFAHRKRVRNESDALRFSERSNRPCRDCATSERDEFPSPHGFPPLLGEL
jgi:hypothetical protein